MGSSILNAGWCLRGSMGVRTWLSTPLPSGCLHFLFRVGLSMPTPWKERHPSREMLDTPRARMPRALQDGDGGGEKEGFLLPPESQSRGNSVQWAEEELAPPKGRALGWLGSGENGGPGTSQAEARAGGPRCCQNPTCSLSFALHLVMTERIARWRTSLDLGLAVQPGWPSPIDQMISTLHFLRPWERGFPSGTARESREQARIPTRHTHAQCQEQRPWPSLTQPPVSHSREEGRDQTRGDILPLATV